MKLTAPGIISIILSVSFAFAAWPWDNDDFAVQVVDYQPGDMAKIPRDYLIYLLEKGRSVWMTDPSVALGAPTAWTTGDYYNISELQTTPVVPVYPAMRYFELVAIAPGGHLILKFARPVRNDPSNPYGIDFIVFGNAFFTHSAVGSSWNGSNPETTYISGNVTAEPATVSVSQDGQTWYEFANVYADSFAPTAGLEWDSANQKWGHPLNPTKPLNPALTNTSFANKSVAEALALYDGSAGGTGFDLAWLAGNPVEWIQYVKISVPANKQYAAEIDAVAIASCGDRLHPNPAGDINKDCRVDLKDFAILVENWLKCPVCQP